MGARQTAGPVAPLDLPLQASHCQRCEILQQAPNLEHCCVWLTTLSNCCSAGRWWEEFCPICAKQPPPWFSFCDHPHSGELDHAIALCKPSDLLRRTVNRLNVGSLAHITKVPCSDDLSRVPLGEMRLAAVERIKSDDIIEDHCSSVEEILSIGKPEARLLFDATDADALEEADFVDDRAVQMRDHSKLADALDSLKRGQMEASKTATDSARGIPILAGPAGIPGGVDSTPKLWPAMPHRDVPLSGAGGMTDDKLDLHLQKVGPELIQHLDRTSAHLTTAVQRTKGTSDMERVELLLNASLDLKRASASIRAVMDGLPQ